MKAMVLPFLLEVSACAGIVYYGLIEHAYSRTLLSFMIAVASILIMIWVNYRQYEFYIDQKRKREERISLALKSEILADKDFFGENIDMDSLLKRIDEEISEKSNALVSIDKAYRFFVAVILPIFIAFLTLIGVSLKFFVSILAIELLCLALYIFAHGVYTAMCRKTRLRELKYYLEF